MTDLNEWEKVEQETAPSLNIEEMQKLVVQYKAAKDFDAEKKKEKTEAFHEMEKCAAKIMSALEHSKQSKFHAEGVGLIYTSTTETVNLPQTEPDKVALLKYFKSKSPEVYLKYVGVNWQSLNSYHKIERENAAAEGEVFSMPGIGDPTSKTTLSFRKA